MKFIKDHKKTFIIAGACLVLMILAFFAIYRMFYPNSSKSIYGERLEGAPAVDNAIIEKIKGQIEENQIVKTISYSLSGRTIKFFIDVKTDTEVSKAQEVTNKITENLSSTILNFYDIQVYITQKDNENAKEYPMVGYKSKDAAKFAFVINKRNAEVGE